MSVARGDGVSSISPRALRGLTLIMLRKVYARVLPVEVRVGVVEVETVSEMKESKRVKEDVESRDRTHR